jgi:hypothetical protein
MRRYIITNADSGHVYGVYLARDPRAAIEAMLAGLPWDGGDPRIPDEELLALAGLATLTATEMPPDWVDELIATEVPS